MSDLEKFIALYASIGIAVDVVPDDRRDSTNQIIKLEADGDYEDGRKGKSKLIGYGCFFTEITFDADGKFLHQGFWE